MKFHEVKKLTEATDRGHLDLVPHSISNAQRMAQHRLNTEQIQAERVNKG